MVHFDTNKTNKKITGIVLILLGIGLIPNLFYMAEQEYNKYYSAGFDYNLWATKVFFGLVLIIISMYLLASGYQMLRD